MVKSNDPKIELICDVVEAIEEINALGPWKKLFLAVYKNEFELTRSREKSKLAAQKAVAWCRRMEEEAEDEKKSA